MDLEKRWPDLLSDLLRQISGHLYHAADFVRFHAVCRPWRDSHDATATATTQTFLPWLLAPDPENNHALSWLICVFSKRSYRAPPLSAFPSWVAGTDGTAVRYFVDSHPYSELRDPLTGAVTLLPPVRDQEDKSWEHCFPDGLVYRDGTILLYNQSGIRYNGPFRFRAALLRPDDAAWTIVERTLGDYEFNKSCFLYHGGKVLISVEDSQWHMVTPGEDASSNMLVQKTWMPTKPNVYYYYKRSHVIESRGEVLYATLHVTLDVLAKSREDVPQLVQEFLLSMYAFQEETSISHKMQHVRKDGHSLADRVLFLGCPNSFAVDASRLRCEGGCAYFVYSGGLGLHNWCGVFKYNIADNKTEFVEWLPKGWGYNPFTWIVPQLTIAPVLTGVTRNSSKFPSISLHRF